MSITYPVTLPVRGFVRFELQPETIVGLSSSEFTAQQQATEHAGDFWVLEASYAPMPRATADPVVAALTALRGRLGTFYVGPRGDDASPKGTATSATVNGAQAAGIKTLAVTLNGTLKAGDYFALAGYLYRVLVDIGGSGTLDIFPKLRAAVAGGETITLASPVGKFRLRDRFQHSVDRANLHYIGFSAIEAI